LTAIFSGLRASEIRGLRFIDIDLDRNELHVRQRADAYGAMGSAEVGSRLTDRAAAAAGR
jgi:integrase